MVKKHSYMLLGLALLVALVTSALAYNWLVQKSGGKKEDVQQAMVAAVDLSWGTVITPEMLKKAPFFTSSLAPGYFVNAASLEGRVLIAPLKANEPILESKLAPLGLKGGGVAAVVSPGKRAMAIRVDKEKGVSGFVHPGNRVDVLVSLNKGERFSQPITKTVLENVPVLAVGTETEVKKRQERPSQVDVITLEVTPEEAERLALASTEGKIQLALRNFVDNVDVKTKGTTINTLLASYSSGTPESALSKLTRQAASKKAKEAPRAEAPAPKKEPAVIVEFIRGSSVYELKYKGGE